MNIATAIAMPFVVLFGVLACTTKPIGVETNPAVPGATGAESVVR